MKRLTFRTSTIVLVIMVISACGGQASPTVNPADVQSTAIAAAFTIVAETQAAIPTATPLPPTDTPTPTLLPTDTPLASPTLQASPTTDTSGVDPCSTRVLGTPKGRATRIRIVNTVKAPVTVSLYLNETDDHNECGYRSYSLGSNGEVVITDLVQGCYNLWAWNDNKKTPVNGASPTSCINNTDKWTFEIRQQSIKFIGP